MSRGALRIGVMLPTAAPTDAEHLDVAHPDPARTLAAAQRAEALGFDGVYVGDHLLHPRPILDAVVTLGAVAAATERVALGPCVLLAALRPPVVLGNELGTLAALAPGRLQVGVGVGGEYPEEFAAAGVPLAERGARTEAAAEHLRAVLPADVPMRFAGWREPALRRAARLGDGWIGYLLDPDGFARRRTLLVDGREAAARPGPFTTGMLVAVHPDCDVEGGRERAAAAWSRLTANGATFPPRLFAAGPSDAIVEQLAAYVAAGADDLVLAVADQGAGFAEHLEVIGAEVLPGLRRLTPA